MLAAGWTYLTSHYSESTLFVATALIHTVLFVVLNGLLHLCHKYSFFEQYRIQKKKYPTPELLWEALKEVTKKHLLVAPISFLLLIPVARWCQVLDKTDPSKTPNTILPSAQEVIIHNIIFILVQDTIFYWCHRMLHIPSLYKRIHKYHHRFHTNVGIASEFAHPIEDTLNTIALLAGPFFMGTHLFTLWVWFFIRIWETVDAHSGYSFPFPISPFALFGVADHHDFHHSHNQGCFGSFFGIWDWMMGTDADYNKWKAAGGDEAKAAPSEQKKTGGGKEKGN